MSAPVKAGGVCRLLSTRWRLSFRSIWAHNAEVMAALPDAQLRKMFGYPAAFANGYMFTGLHQANWVVRLPSDGLDELSAAGGRAFEPMPGRPMSGYLAFPQQMVAAGAPALLPWIERSLDFVRSLPPKESARKSR